MADTSPLRRKISSLQGVFARAMVSPAFSLTKCSFTFSSMLVKSSEASPWSKGSCSNVSNIVSIAKNCFWFGIKKDEGSAHGRWKRSPVHGAMSNFILILSKNSDNRLRRCAATIAFCFFYYFLSVLFNPFIFLLWNRRL